MFYGNPAQLLVQAKAVLLTLVYSAVGTFIILRNTERKDNEFNALDLRLSKNIAVGGLQVEPILEVFNVFDEPNFLRPEVTNGVAASFDGTIRSGGGDPRQVQVGLRVAW